MNLNRTKQEKIELELEDLFRCYNKLCREIGSLEMTEEQKDQKEFWNKLLEEKKKEYINLINSIQFYG